MDEIVIREGKVDKLIQKFIELCNEVGLPPEMTSVFIKSKLKGFVSDETIQKHLPSERKRRYARYQSLEKITETDIDDKKEIEISSSGKEEIRGRTKKEEDEVIGRYAPETIPDPNKPDWQTKYLGLEAYSNKRINQLEVEKANMEVELNELKKKPIVRQEKNLDRLEDIEVENQNLKYEVNELKEALRTKVKSDFVSASEVENPKTVWVAAINLGGFAKVLNGMWLKLTPAQEKGKIIFDISSDGSIKNPRPE